MMSKPVVKPNAYNEISLLLDYSERIYREYLNANNQFIYANILRKTNEKLYQCLMKYSSFFQEQSRKDAIELMFHLDVWKEIWDDEFEKQKPNLTDSFTFNNDVNFPKEEVKQLLSELASLSE